MLKNQKSFGRTKAIRGVALMLCIVMALVCFMPMTITTAKASSKILVRNSGGWLESAYVEWYAADGAKNYKVYIRKDNGSYGVINDSLIRRYQNTDGFYYRADVPGLASGSYMFKVVPVINGAESTANATETPTVSVASHDRTGFAWSGGSANGAYNADGTLKSNALVLYVSEATKNTVSITVATGTKKSEDGKKTETIWTTYKGIQQILNAYKKGHESRPLCIRVVGKVTDPSDLVNGDLFIDTNKKSITIEGIGPDAVLSGWGITVKGSSNIEIRNLGFMLTDSNSGDSITIQDGSDHVWIHNCDFFYGLKGTEGKGDVSVNSSKSNYITYSYNHYWDCGSTGISGASGESASGMYVTYHHNWYDHSDADQPRIRYYSAHVYNNYFDGNSRYGIAAAMGASIFAEANYFRNCRYPMISSMQGSDEGALGGENGGIIKATNNYMTGQGSYITYNSNTSSFDAYDISKKSQKVPGSVVAKNGGKSYNNFDTSSTMYKYSVDTAVAARSKVMKYAGRVEGGDFDWTFSNSDDTIYTINNGLMQALKNYKGRMISVGSADTGEGVGSTGSQVPAGTETTASGENESTGSSESIEASEASSEKATTSSGSSTSTSTNDTSNDSNPKKDGGGFPWIIVVVVVIAVAGVVIYKKKNG